MGDIFYSRLAGRYACICSGCNTQLDAVSEIKVRSLENNMQVNGIAKEAGWFKIKVPDRLYKIIVCSDKCISLALAKQETIIEDTDPRIKRTLSAYAKMALNKEDGRKEFDESANELFGIVKKEKNQ